MILATFYYCQYSFNQELGNLPKMVELYFSSANTHAGNYQVIRIIEENISDYINFQNLLMKNV